MTEERVFRLEFLLVDDDPSLNRLVRAALGTRKLRRLYQGAIRERCGEGLRVRSAMHYASSAEEARKVWADLRAETAGEGELSGQCTVALLDFDMPGENGLELAASLKDEAIEMMLFTGRQPQMEAFLAESGKDLADFGVLMTMLKGAPAHELNAGVLELLGHRLNQIEC